MVLLLREEPELVLGSPAPDVLVIDDLGLRPLERDEPLDLYEIIRARYEVGSMVVTSNRAIEEW